MVEEEPVGILVKRIREKKGMSKRKLATLSGLNRTYILRLEQGNPKSITLTTARKLAVALGVRPEIFLSSEDSEFLYFYKNTFEGMLKDFKEQYHISGDQ
jgi:transcriptional regulator with XRE-family HTH domain